MVVPTHNTEVSGRLSKALLKQTLWPSDVKNDVSDTTLKKYLERRSCRQTVFFTANP